MVRTEEHFQFSVCHKTDLARVLRGHHVYMSCWSTTIGERLFAAPDTGEEAKHYDKFVISMYKLDNNVLVGHVPIESLCYHFLQEFPGNKIDAVITGKRHREVGLVVPAKKIFFKLKTKDVLR